MGEYREDTRVTKVSDTLWKGVVTPRWNIGAIPNGGYLMGIAVNVIREGLPHPDPLTITGHYIDRGEAGDCDIAFENIREGRSVSTGCARLIQGGRERARFTATYGDLSRTRGETWIGTQPPAWPDPDRCLQMPKTLAIHDRLDMLFAPEEGAWIKGDLSGKPEHLLTFRFADGSDPDVLSLPFFCDCVPPTVFAVYGFAGWVPTLELTVQVRARPAPGRLLGRFITRYLTNGLLEVDGEIWDSANQLVALSRQLAKYRKPDPV
ncbi:MAG: thioesterase family protein [Ketobacteraceae bacterium]|nr:thioesterase family protein [Ketobacteraceae bacterium]